MFAKDLSGALVQLSRQEPPVAFQQCHPGPALRQSAGRFQAQQPSTDTHAAGPCLARLQKKIGVLHRPQAGDPLAIRSGDGRDKGTGAGRQQELVERQTPAVAQLDGVAGRMQSGHLRSQQELDLLLLVPSRRMDEEFWPVDFSGKVARQVEAVVGQFRLLGDQDDFRTGSGLAQRFHGGHAGAPGTDHDDSSDARSRSRRFGPRWLGLPGGRLILPKWFKVLLRGAADRAGRRRFGPAVDISTDAADPSRVYIGHRRTFLGSFSFPLHSQRLAVGIMLAFQSLD